MAMPWGTEICEKARKWRKLRDEALAGLMREIERPASCGNDEAGTGQRQLLGTWRAPPRGIVRDLMKSQGPASYMPLYTAMTASSATYLPWWTRAAIRPVCRHGGGGALSRRSSGNPRFAVLYQDSRHPSSYCRYVHAHLLYYD